MWAQSQLISELKGEKWVNVKSSPKLLLSGTFDPRSSEAKEHFGRNRGAGRKYCWGEEDHVLHPPFTSHLLEERASGKRGRIYDLLINYSSMQPCTGCTNIFSPTRVTWLRAVMTAANSWCPNFPLLFLFRVWTLVLYRKKSGFGFYIGKKRVVISQFSLIKNLFEVINSIQFKTCM